MLRPNSPRPPSGTTSTGGAPADTGAPRTHSCDIPAERSVPRRSVQGNLQATCDPGGSKRSPFQAAGRPGKTGGFSSETIAQLQLTRREAKTSRKRGHFDQLQRLGPPLADRCRPRRAPSPASTPALDARTASARCQRLAPLGEHRPHHARRTAAGRRSSTGGGRNASRTTAECTFGGGRNAPAAATAAASHRRASAGQTVSTPYSPVPALATSRSATSFCSISVASRTPPVVAASSSSAKQDRRRDVVGKVADDADLIAGLGRRAEPVRRRSRRGRPSRTSPCTTVTFGSAAARAPRRDRDRPRRRAAGRPAPPAGAVIAPRPGPISTNDRRASAPSAATSLATQAGSRKCWPNRLRASHRSTRLRRIADRSPRQ